MQDNIKLIDELPFDPDDEGREILIEVMEEANNFWMS